MARIQTAEKTFIFDLSVPESNTVKGVFYVDIGQIHNLVNRFSARQGFEYVVQSLEIGVQPGGNFQATIYRLPEHWPCVNAWEKTMSLWKQQQDDRADEAGLESTTARYRDFKIHFDAGHVTAGFGANLIPSGYAITDGAGTNESYQWVASEVVVPNSVTPGNTVEYDLHMLGPDNGAASRGMILAYAQSRQRPQQTDPNIVDVASGGLFGTMFDVGDDTGEIITNLQDNNEQPPYLLGRDGTEEYYPGGGFQGIGPISSATGTPEPGQMVDIIGVNNNMNYNSDTCPGFVAPCGLIKVALNASGVLTPSPADTGTAPFPIWMKLTLAAGEYKGVLALPMQEVN